MAEADRGFLRRFDSVENLMDDLVEPRATWNYRVIELKEAGETRLEIREVHYEDGKLRSYAAGPAVLMETTEEDEVGPIESLRWQLERMMEGLTKPVLKPEDFPAGES